MTDAPETIETVSPNVCCNGTGQLTTLATNLATALATTLGHPAVYLNMGADREIQCPYCSRLFVLESGAKVGSPAH